MFLRYILRIGLDLTLALSAAVVTLLLVSGGEVTLGRLLKLVPYLGATTVAAALAIVGFRLYATIWRFSSRGDYWAVTWVALVTVGGAASATFLYNRLDGVPRSAIVFQSLLMAVSMVCARELFRYYHAKRRIKRSIARVGSLEGSEGRRFNVLIVGITPLTDAYLYALDTSHGSMIRVVGLLGRGPHQTGRVVNGMPVLGAPSNIVEILEDLENRGLRIRRIVIAIPFEQLPAGAREHLIGLQNTSDLELQLLDEDLRIRDRQAEAASRRGDGAVDDPGQIFCLSQEHLAKIRSRQIWRIKRFLDVVCSVSALVLLLPLFGIIAVGVLLALGRPVVFSQYRLGMGGQEFKLYKFRTMGPIRGPDGRRLSDAERTSRIGGILRQLRMDELPQLLNVIRGEMSLVGPRPLLAEQQSEALSSRLIIRPGLTGWAQIAGGREVSTSDKFAMDVWYLLNATLFLDFRIVLKTLPFLVRREEVARGAIEKAWGELESAGVLRHINRLS